MSGVASPQGAQASTAGPANAAGGAVSSVSSPQGAQAWTAGPPPPPPPPPTAGAPPRLVPQPLALAALGVGAAAAMVLPGNRAGVGLAAVWVAVVAAVLVTAPRSLGTWDVGFLALSLALGGVPAIIDAPWIVAPAVGAAVSLASLALSRGRTWRQVLAGMAVIAARVSTASAPLARTLRRASAGARGLAPAIRAAAIAGALLAVFGTLFFYADQAFAYLAQRFLIPDLSLALLPARIAVLVGTALLVGGLATCERTTARASGAVATARLRRSEWLPGLLVVDLLFAAFVSLQITVLFGGSEHVLATAGLTYAEYARSGFFQLMAVAALVLALTAVCVRLADGQADRRLLQILLGILCLLTLVILASALRRLWLYEQVFGYTRLRLSVEATIYWLGGVFGAVLAAGALWRAAWLPRAVVAFSAVCLLVFALASPDAIIAARNVARFRDTGQVDVSYLAVLGADAVPALLELPEEQQNCALQRVHSALTTSGSWPGWNVSRARARAALGLDGAPGGLSEVVQC